MQYGGDGNCRDFEMEGEILTKKFLNVTNK